MGNSFAVDTVIRENPNRNFFIQFKSMRSVPSPFFGNIVVFTFIVKHQRYSWEIELRFNELCSLDNKLLKDHREELITLARPAKFNKLLWTHDKQFLNERALILNKYLQDLLDLNIQEISNPFRRFLNISAVSLNPDMGKKGLEGYMKKCSGGYIEKFSRKTGDFFNMWTWRWIVMYDSCICWYASPEETVPRGTLQIDPGFQLRVTGRLISILTDTRRLLLFASTTREALLWEQHLHSFYKGSHKLMTQHFNSYYPPRMNSEVKVYTITKDYFSALAVSLLSAQKEVLICNWKNSPTVILTRPPLPALRLDQILKYKANQGVKIFLLLYKEVEGIGQGNDSGRAKSYLESLSPNIHCIRHPNKFIGGSTAVLWSHHEKTVVIDRNLVYVGGVDLAFQRWDDGEHRCVDEDGTHCPGLDYRNPTPGLFIPAREYDPDEDALLGDDDEGVEVEVVMGVDAQNLPEATVAAFAEDDGQPYEVEVVVDFGLTEDFVSVPTPSTMSPSAQGRQAPAASMISSSVADIQLSSSTPMGASADNMSEVSANWAEDRYMPETEEERRAMQEAMASQRASVASTAVRGTTEVSHNRSSVAGSTSSSTRTGKKSSRGSIMDSFKYFSDQIKQLHEHHTTTRTTKKTGSLEPRDMYPRMAWHDLQCAVTGRVARDVASHFIQRWNHHRLSTSQYHEPILQEITDDIFYGICAKCGMTNIMESAERCPACYYNLGPGNSYSQPVDPEKCPVDPSDFSFVSFRCTFNGVSPLPFRYQGDCPVVVTGLKAHVGGLSDVDGDLLDAVGPQAEWLEAFGLIPGVGDVVYAIDDTVVTHLNSNQLKRLIRKRKLKNKIFELGSAMKEEDEEEKVDLVDDGSIRSSSVSPMMSGKTGRSGSMKNEQSLTTIKITFRRHYLENYYPTTKKIDSTKHLNGTVVEAQEIGDETETDATTMKELEFASSKKEEPFSNKKNSIKISNTENLIMYMEESKKKEFPHKADDTLFDENQQILVTAPPMSVGDSKEASLEVVTLQMLDEKDDTMVTKPASVKDVSAPPSAAVPVESPLLVSSTTEGTRIQPATDGISNQKIAGSGGDVAPDQMTPEGGANEAEAVTVDAAGMKENEEKVAQFHPACQAAAHQEIRLAMSTLFHQESRFLDIPKRLTDNMGTCKVQLLRSVGKWSVGTKTDSSIMNCWVETIRSANHFIYIENQFFVGSLAGPDVSNTVPEAITERIIKAFNEKQPFKVIVVIPVHPNGDYISALKAKVVMHYEYQTINRGLTCMFTHLQLRAPGINIRDYIGFYSLRNWGVLNNKVMSEQVYVHDKLLIVDDRVMIIGSANINDRSMLGNRDSELAVRIEDTTHISIKMGGSPFTVGWQPHFTRVKLMKQHLGTEIIDISDPISKETTDYWNYISNKNSSVYDELDGNLSVYRVKSINDFKKALQFHKNKSYLDPQVQHSMSEIQGFLVDWPKELHNNEDLSPSLATRTLIPNDLWV